MPGDPSNLPARQTPLDRTAIERVLARAAELQGAGAGADTSGQLSESQLIEIGREVGIAPTSINQALAEERSRITVVEEEGFFASVTGPAVATASRTVRGTAAAVLSSLDEWMQREECLRVQRKFPDRVTWEPKSGFFDQVQRGLNISGRGYHLTRTSQVGATVVPVDAGRVLVRLDADISESRATRVRVAGAALVAGIIGSGAIAVLGAALVAPELALWLSGAAALPTLAGAGAGYQIGKAHRQLVLKVQLALEQTLDRLEYGSMQKLV